MENPNLNPPPKMTWIDQIIRFFLEEKLITLIFMLVIIGWGIMVAPFDWDVGLPRDNVPVDAIPDIGENQQIVFTDWLGRSPQDVENQITYPLTSSLLGVPGVRSIRSYSMFGFSSIYVIFQDKVDFYWSRSRILEKLNSLPEGLLPEGVKPTLGPDATALGQVFWYTLEGHNEKGEPVGGWDLQELRTIQDWYVRYSLLAAEGISEIASIGGFVKEYQIDVDPDAMRAYEVTLEDVYEAVMMSNLDVGARSIEINKVEYVIRGLGFIKQLADLEDTVVKVNKNVPIYIRQVAKVNLGPALRTGALDKEGAEAVGAVAVVRFGENPLKAINNLKRKIKEISPGLPRKTLPDGTVSQVKIVPFYDRTQLIYETLGTLNDALRDQILVIVIVVVFLLKDIRSSILNSALLPLAVMMCFILMKFFGVSANIMALSGIAIAIGTVNDMGVIICENILGHLAAARPEESRLEVIFRAASEVGSAVVTAIATTVVSFLPVFTMSSAEAKLFKPLAYTKTFALISSVIIALTVIPAFAHIFYGFKIERRFWRQVRGGFLFLLGLGLGFWLSWYAALALIIIAIYYLAEPYLPEKWLVAVSSAVNVTALVVVVLILTSTWLPLGRSIGYFRNLIFVGVIIGSALLFYYLFLRFYRKILWWCLEHKLLFLSVPTIIFIFGLCVWLGFARIFSFIPKTADSLGLPSHAVHSSRVWSAFSHALPGLGREFMPPLEEGSFLFMPSLMPHASTGEALDILQKQNAAISSIPEVETAVGKIGRAESPLDPAPISMIETIINYKSEYKTDKNGRVISFKINPQTGEFLRDAQGELVPDKRGKPFRQWRQRIKSVKDIWDEIIKTAQIPGVTSAPYLQPIGARIVMLQSGMRSSMGVKIKGPDLVTLEKVALQIESFLKEVPVVEPSTVIADRIVGVPYLEIDIDRKAIARYGLSISQVQEVIEVAIGGKMITTTIEGRERYPVRVRYQRELRDTIESLGNILIPGKNEVQIPLKELAEIRYLRGPMVIKSEDTFLTAYVLFDKKTDLAEVDVVTNCRDYLEEKIGKGELVLPAGASYSFAGSYENQVRSEKRLLVIVPITLLIIFMILYFDFRSWVQTTLVFSSIIVSASGAFLLLWFYGQSWFLNFSVFGQNLRDIFQVHPINLSAAVWVGFIALFGIASDDGVVMNTYLGQSFAKRTKLSSITEIREAVLEAGSRRSRPCVMTTATTILALLPILTATGRGADIMMPMAIPSFGGMTIELITLFISPTLYCAWQEFKFKRRRLRRSTLPS